MIDPKFPGFSIPCCPEIRRGVVWISAGGASAVLAAWPIPICPACDYAHDKGAGPDTTNERTKDAPEDARWVKPWLV